MRMDENTTDDERRRIKMRVRKQRHYAKNREAIRKACYLRHYDAGKIRCPRESTKVQYGL